MWCDILELKATHACISGWDHDGEKREEERRTQRNSLTARIVRTPIAVASRILSYSHARTKISIHFLSEIQYEFDDNRQINNI